MRHLPQCFKAPKSRILSTRRLRRALLIPKPQHLQLIDRVHSHSKTAEQDASVTDGFHSIFLLHRGFQETVQIRVCAEVQLEGAASSLSSGGSQSSHVKVFICYTRKFIFLFQQNLISNISIYSFICKTVLSACLGIGTG